MQKRTLVLGASLKTDRYSNIVIKKLIDKGHKVSAIGAKEGIVEGVHIKTDAEDFDRIDTVTLYLNPSRQAAYYDYIIALNPKRVIFNPGTENMEFIRLLQENSIEAEIACNLVLLATNQF